MNSTEIRLSLVTSLLREHRFHATDEGELQVGIHQALVSGLSSVPLQEYGREVRLGSGDIIDFFVDGVGIEVKVDGSLSSVTRQLHRYAQYEQVQALILITTRMKHRNLPDKINGKPLEVILVTGI